MEATELIDKLLGKLGVADELLKLFGMVEELDHALRECEAR